MKWRSRGAVPYKLAGAVPRVQDCCKLYLVKLSMDSSHYTITLDIVRLQCSGGVVAQSPTSLQVGGSDLLLDCCILYSVKLSMDSGHYTITLDIVRLQWSGGVVVQSPTSWRERSPEYRTAVTMEWRSRGAVPYKLAGAVPRVQDCCKLYLVKLSMDSSHYTITLDIVRLQWSGGVVAQSPTSWRERSPGLL
ncbi:hypothetical protein J6590_018960 [Homalodisca vitripennis]|nr:hypothetical protein J6590_018960 [Homalodisca vitripennis]